MPDEITTPQQEPSGVTPASAPVAAPEKTFTQAEVDAMIGKRLAKAMKGMPDEAELAAYRSWAAGRQTEQDRTAALQRERDAATTRATELETQIEQMKRSNYLQAKGLQGDEAEFIAFKAEKLVSDKVTFEAAVDSLIAERQQKPAFRWTAPLEHGAAPAANANNTMNALIRQARR